MDEPSGDVANPEIEDWEEKSSFEGTDRELMEVLVKTVVAMANTAGGTIRLRNVTCDARILDSAAIDDLVNKYVGPRVRGISSECREAVWYIRVEKSSDAPHIFQASRDYDHKGKTRTAFYPGQVFVRHSSKTEPATTDDIRRMLNEHAASWLAQMSAGIRSFAVRMTNEPTAFPVSVSDRPGLTIDFADPNERYPHTAKSVGLLLGKEKSWIGATASLLNLKGDPQFSWPAKGADGQVLAWKYSDEAVSVIRQHVAENPGWNPHRARQDRQRLEKTEP